LTLTTAKSLNCNFRKVTANWSARWPKRESWPGTGLKEKHKGRIYGVYVCSEFRRRGIGRALLANILETVSGDSSLEQVLVSVATCQNAARELYHLLGFETYGTEPRALKVGATYIDEDEMILRIR
jgi:ribosomal protein S18 acetylase RimI-like enzyme